jgi:protein-L-isoaspartate(D-aspartate) O-methyltransferase
MYESRRKELAELLYKRGIKSKTILKAFIKVERHLFVPKAMEHVAYKDTALNIGYGQTISQPYTIAVMTEALEAKPGNRILEIGTGSGYQAALLIEMGMNVFSIERNYELFENTRKLLESLNYRAYLKWGDGTIGLEEFAPFDGIIVTAGSPKIPAPLKKQLSIGGKLVIPVGDKISQTMKVLKKISEDEFETTDIPEFTFVPLIGREGWSQR